MNPLPVAVEVADLAALSGPVVVADVRWYLDGRSGREAYENGHIPGAIFVDLDRDLAAHDQPATQGRHPFPAPADFAQAMSTLGIGDDCTVVAYDDTGGMTAGRLVVMLRMLGHAATLLNGGLATWSTPLDVGPSPAVAPALFSVQPWPSHRLAAAHELGHAPSQVLALDGRAAARFTGEVAMVDPRPGHIPGAVNAPWQSVLQADTNRLRTATDLHDHYKNLGVAVGADVVAYCGSGVSACLNVLGLEHAGFQPPRLYVASFSGWASDPDRPTAVGPGR